MKKIIHIITGLNDGGAEAVLYRLCKADKDNKHIVISMMDEGKYGPLLIEEGVVLYCLNLPAGRITFLSLLKLFRIIRQYSPNVVQTWMYHADLIGGIVARLAGVRNVVWGVHNTTLVKGESKISTILVAKLNTLLSYIIPRKIIYCAQKSREVQESIGYKSTKGIVVSNGYDVNKFLVTADYRSAFRQEIGIASDEFLIGHVGRFDSQKDHKNLLDALGILKKNKIPFRAIFVGTQLDNCNSILVECIKSNDIFENVSLLGRRNDIPVVMNGFDLFVLSSLAEAFPNVLNESMACGTPCVTTDVGDAAVIVGNTGWVVPTKDSQALADAITFAYHEKQNDKQVWSLRKESARKRIVENFSIEKMIVSYRKVWFIK